MSMIVACSKEKELRAPEETKVAPIEHIDGWDYIRATNGDSKAIIDDSSAEFSWAAGDKIALFSGDTYYKSEGLADAYDDNTDVEFAFTTAVNAGRADFAVYPADLVFDGDNVRANSVSNHAASSLTLTLPASYALADVQGAKSVTPMIALNAPDGTLYFKSICALLRLTLENVPKQTKSISFTFGGKKVQGEFTLSGVNLGDLDSFAGVQVNPSSASDSTITVTGVSIDALTKDFVVSIPVPVAVASSCEYKTVTVTTLDEQGHKINSYRASVKSSGNWVPSRKSSRKLSVTLPVFTSQGTTAFNDGVKVVFAPGNLRATLEGLPAANTPGYASKWEFAPHQYDTIATYTPTGRQYSINSIKDPKVGDVIDLFCWCGESATGFTGSFSDDKYKYGILNSSGSGVFTGSSVSTGASDHILKDWGTLEISDGADGYYPSGTWRLPNDGPSPVATNTVEWNHLTQKRSCASGYRNAKATILNGETLIARGLILFPDTYTHPSGVRAINGKASGHSNVAYTQNLLQLSEWEQMEAVGCVFLPVTNIRDSQTTVYYGDMGYWSNYTKDKANAAGSSMADYTLWPYSRVNGKSSTTPKYKISSSAGYGEKSIGKNLGAAVRLIRVVN